MTPEQIHQSARKIMDMHGISVQNVAEVLERGACFDNGDGFIIVEPVKNQELLIWLCVSRGTLGFVERNLEELKRIGRDLGARNLVFYSKRRGWARAASGWKVMPDSDRLRYEMEL